MIVGSVTDAYNPQEETFCRSRAFLKQMQGSKINLIITTKSDLVVRDLDLLRGGFKADILNYIGEKYPDLLPLYRQIYSKNDMSYWNLLDKKVAEYAKNNGFLYVIDEEPFLRNPTGKPVIINYFYHSQITQSAKTEKR